MSIRKNKNLITQLNIKTIVKESQELIDHILKLSNDEAKLFITNIIDKCDSDYNTEVLRLILTNSKVKSIVNNETNYLELI